MIHKLLLLKILIQPRYLNDLLNIENSYFEGLITPIYPYELQLNKANSTVTETLFLDLYLLISNVFVSSKMYDKRNDFYFDIANSPFLDSGVHHASSIWYISQLIRLYLIVWLASMLVKNFTCRTSPIGVSVS